MLTMYVESPAGMRHKQFVPAPSFRLVGNSLRSHKNDEIAVHQGGIWHTSQDPLIVLAINTPTVIHFEDREGNSTPAIGPHERVRIVSWVIRVGPDDLPVAILDERTGTWIACQDQQRWPIVVLANARPTLPSRLRFEPEGSFAAIGAAV